MSGKHQITIGKQVCRAKSGQVLLDAALESGISVPHDCRAGRCGSCVASLRRGITLGGESHQRGMVYMCQARVFSDLIIDIEDVPPVELTRGRIVEITDIASDIVEVAIEPVQPINMLAGQYCRFAFKGYPARCFSPTQPLNRINADDDIIRLNIKRVHDGRVTPLIGDKIGVGHSVEIEGPFGHAFLRQNRYNRLVLIGSGTGFAPMWAVATAALTENPERQITLVAASRESDSFYMTPALLLATRFPGVEIVASVAGETLSEGKITNTRAVDHLSLSQDDIVYAAGAPALVDAVGERANTAGSRFYADPFASVAEQDPANWFDNARSWLRAS